MTEQELDQLFQMEDAALAAVRAQIRLEAQATPPSPTSSRLTASDLVYQRSFRLPREASNGQGFDFGGRHLALAANGQTLFVGNRQSHVAEITIPTDDGAFAEYVQGFVDPTEGQLAATFGDAAALSGLLVDGDRLLGTVSVYYDANNQQRVSHFSRSRHLADRGHVSDFVSVWKTEQTGFVAGYLAPVPGAWVTRLKGSIVTGQFGIPIVSRTSQGPAAFALEGLAGAFVPAVPLVYYPGEHPTLGSWNGSNPVYGGTATCGGLAIVDDTALFVGRNGTGPFSYGIGTADLALDGTADGEGGVFCYDPANSDKGQHAYPYRYQVWAYALADFADVAAGRTLPWDLIPQVWALELPTPEPTVKGIGGVAFDATTRQLYVSQLHADQDGYAYRALIHVFTVTG